MTTSAFREEVAKQIGALSKGDDPDAKITFDNSLSAEQRKYVHHIAQQFGLKSQSTGKGANRCIAIWRCKRLDEKRAQPGPNDDHLIPDVQITTELLQEITSKLPPMQGEPNDPGPAPPMQVESLAELQLGRFAHSQQFPNHASSVSNGNSGENGASGSTKAKKVDKGFKFSQYNKK